MLGKKSIYRRPIVILASLVVLFLLNMVVVNNPIFATRISDLTEQTDSVSEMSVEESNAQLAEMADSTPQVVNAPEEDMSTLLSREASLR
jgi:hypothetical protein